VTTELLGIRLLHSLRTGFLSLRDPSQPTPQSWQRLSFRVGGGPDRHTHILQFLDSSCTFEAAAMASECSFSFKCAAARLRLMDFLMSRDCAFSSALKGSSWEIRLSAACAADDPYDAAVGPPTLMYAVGPWLMSPAGTAVGQTHRLNSSSAG